MQTTERASTAATSQEPVAVEKRGLANAAYYPIIVVGLAMMTQGGFTLLGQGFAPFLPFIQEEFGLTNTHIGFFTGAIFVATAAASTFFGWAIDRFGERVIIGLFLSLGAATVLLVPMAPGFLALLGIAVLLGIFRSPGNAAGGRAVVGWVSKKRRGTAMGVKQAGSSVFAAAAAIGVPVIAAAYGWRVAAVVTGVVLILTALLILALYREPTTADERKKKSTSLKQGLIEIARNKDARYVMAMQFMLLGVEVTIATYLILFLNESHGLSLVAAGGLLAVFQLSSVIMRIGWGMISDNLWGSRRKPPLLVGCIAAVGVLVVLAALPMGGPQWALFLAAAGLGATVRGLTPLNHTLLAEVTDRARVGLVMGVSGTVGRSSTFILPPVFGILADVLGFRWAWLVLGVLMATTLLTVVGVEEADWESEATA